MKNKGPKKRIIKAFSEKELNKFQMRGDRDQQDLMDALERSKKDFEKPLYLRNKPKSR